MIKITFPDGSIREYEKGITGLEIAKSISPALARDVLSIGVNGKTTRKGNTRFGIRRLTCWPKPCKHSTLAFSSALVLP